MGSTWELGRQPLGRADRDAVGPCLERAGADSSLLDLYETTVRAGTRLTRPAWLVEREAGRVRGLALVVLCRDYGVSFVGPSRLAPLARAGPSIWYWDRTTTGADGVSCPGLVADGVDLEEFVGRAVRRLSRRAVGTLVDTRPPSSAHLAHPFVGGCSVTLPARDPGSDGGRDEQPEPPSRAVLAAHRNLPRKVRRFAGRGGTVQTLHGRMPDALRPSLLAGYAVERPVSPPWAQMYPRLVRAQWDLDDVRLVHLVARIDGEPVGYQTFWRAGRHLAMLSGVLGRRDGGTAHAYENLLLASLDLAADLGCLRMDVGLGINAAKVSLLGSRANALYFVSRWPPVRGALRAALPRTRISSARLDALRDVRPGAVGAARSR